MIGYRRRRGLPNIVRRPVKFDPILDRKFNECKDMTAKETTSRKGLFGRLRERLQKTRSGLADGLAQLVRGRKQIDDALLEEIETLLLSADVGVDATQGIIDSLTERVGRRQLADGEALYHALQDDLLTILRPCSQPLIINKPAEGPFVILVVGVNGAGKTTTIGKLAKRLQGEGHAVMLAAADTFRAAAVEQLVVWGERNGIPVVSQQRAADPAAVVYDAMQSATARAVDVLIVDTAGRLHTQKNLMEELRKINRVLGRVDDTAPHEVMLVLDAGTGQNALSQAAQFNDATTITGLTLSKLDGTAKGGVIFAMAQRLGIPIRFIGIGEDIDGLRVFDAEEFVRALFEA